MDNNDTIFSNGLGFGDLPIYLKSLGRQLFKCEQCEKTSKTEQFQYKNAKYISDYDPKFWKALCKKCLKREAGKRIFNKFIMGE